MGFEDTTQNARYGNSGHWVTRSVISQQVMQMGKCEDLGTHMIYITSCTSSILFSLRENTNYLNFLWINDAIQHRSLSHRRCYFDLFCKLCVLFRYSFFVNCAFMAMMRQILCCRLHHFRYDPTYHQHGQGTLEKGSQMNHQLL